MSLPPLCPKPKSACCEKPAKVNMIARAFDGDRTYFCTHCGESCDLSQRRKPFKSTLSAVRKPSGEKALFVHLWAQRGGRSQISGEPLLPPEHPMFHFQGAHVLCKNTYPEQRLNPENIFLVTVDEHQYQTNEPEKCRQDPAWKAFWATFDRLKAKAYQQ